MRESRNVILIATTPPTPSLDECGFHEQEFTYADRNDMILGVPNYTTNHSVDALPPSTSSTTVTLGSALMTLLLPLRMRLRTTGLHRLEKLAFLSRVTVHLHLPHHLPVLLRPVHHQVLRRGLVRRVLVLLQLVLHRGVVPRVCVIHLVVGVTPAVALRVVHLREEGSLHVVDVVR